MTQWQSIDTSLPAFGNAVLLKCKGWDPIIAHYMANPHCHFNDHIHAYEDGRCVMCCGIWMIFDHPARPGRVVNAQIQGWCEIPKLTKDFK